MMYISKRTAVIAIILIFIASLGVSLDKGSEQPFMLTRGQDYYPTPSPAPAELHTEEPAKRDEITSGKRININTATEKELIKLDGIGETFAKRIVEYRNANGGFKSIEEIKKIKGIGEKRFAAIRDVIFVE